MSFFTLNMVRNSVLYDSAKTPFLGRICFFSYGLKCSQPIRLQCSLIINISGGNQTISQIFSLEIIIKERQHLRLPPLFGCDQLNLSSNQTAGFYDNQYLGKKSSNLLDFLYADNHQEKVAFKTTTLVARCTFGPIRLWDSLKNNISERNQLIPLSNYCQFFVYFLAFFLKYSGVHLVVTWVQSFYPQQAFTCSKLTIKNTGRRCEICSKLTIKTPKRRH